MTAFDSIGVNNIPFLKNFDFLRKTCLNVPVFTASLEYKVIKIFNHSLHTLCSLILRGAIIEGYLIFYSKYIDWDGANKWGNENHYIRERINSFCV